MVINHQRQYIYVLRLAGFITIDKLAQNPNLFFWGVEVGDAGVSEFLNKQFKFV